MNATINFIRPSRVHTRSLLGISGCLLVTAFAFGCSDDTNTATSSGSQTGSGGSGASDTGGGGTGGEATGGTGGVGGGGGAGGEGGAGGTGGSAAVEPVIIPVSDAGHDRFFGVTFDPQGNIYATGTVADSTDAAADHSMIVAKFLPTGVLDPAFGTGGIATHNVEVGTNGEVARGIVVQSTGKIVIAGTVEHKGAADPRDRDIAVVRFNPDGKLDSGFGTGGVATLDLSAGEVVGNGYVADSQWGLSVYKDDRLLVVGAQKALGGTDTDFAVARLTPDGALDNEFGTGGVTTLDINKQGASPRTGTILPDGSVVVVGYTRDADDVVSPVLFKLTSTGQFDPGFGVNGVFNQIVLGSVTEAYGAVLQGTKLVTAGYGRNSAADSLDWVSLRITEDGKLDSTYGMNGSALVDVAGQNDNARSLVTLPDDRILIVGGGRPSADDVDGMVGVLTPDGKADSTFAAPGYKLYDLGGTGDMFWSVALSPTQKFAAVVGTKGVGMAAGDDDAALLLLPIGN